MTDLTQKSLIVYRSENGRDNWRPVKPEEVPEWVKHPDTMAIISTGGMACDPKRGEEWYRAEIAPVVH